MSTEPEEVEEVVEAQEPQYDPEIAETAKQYGWKSPDDWEGEPPEHGFMDPEEYMARPKIAAGYFKDQAASVQAKLAEKEAEFDRRIASMQAMEAESARRRAENHQAEIERLKREQRNAVSEMDEDRFDALATEIEALGPVPEVPTATPKYTPLPGEMEAVTAWKAKPENAWFGRSQTMADDAMKAYSVAADTGINDPAQRLAFVENRMAALYPGIVSAAEPQRKRPAAVDGGGLGGRKVSKSSKLPPEVRAAAERDIKDGLFKDMNEYAETYFAQYGEG